jgi:hypothetical protein
MGEGGPGQNLTVSGCHRFVIDKYLQQITMWIPEANKEEWFRVKFITLNFLFNLSQTTSFDLT